MNFSGEIIDSLEIVGFNGRGLSEIFRIVFYLLVLPQKMQYLRLNIKTLEQSMGFFNS